MKGCRKTSEDMKRAPPNVRQAPEESKTAAFGGQSCPPRTPPARPWTLAFYINRASTVHGVPVFSFYPIFLRTNRAWTPNFGVHGARFTRKKPGFCEDRAPCGFANACKIIRFHRDSASVCLYVASECRHWAADDLLEPFSWLEHVRT